MLSEWKIVPGTRKPDVMEMTDFKVLTINSRAFPGTAPLVVKHGERVRIRLGNLGATDHHPIHIHGHNFRITGTDGGRIPSAGQWPMTHHVMNQMGHGLPNMMGVDAKTIDPQIQLLPQYLTMGDTGMRAMADMRMAGPRNSIPMLGGKGPFATIDMGGMFTVIKVRDDLAVRRPWMVRASRGDRCGARHGRGASSRRHRAVRELRSTSSIARREFPNGRNTLY